MTLVHSDALVLHHFDYAETSRIVRLVTREGGLVSAVAKGARRPRSPIGSATDLFSSGQAQLYVKSGRELHTLAAFEVRRSRTHLAGDLDRFAAANAIAELVLLFARDGSGAPLYEMLETAFDALAGDSGAAASDTGLAWAWRLVAHFGFAPTVDTCAMCGIELDSDQDASFSHRAGGTVCRACAGHTVTNRLLPSRARLVLRECLQQGAASLGSTADRRAHLRLLREFMVEHITDSRTLRAFPAWERRWSERAAPADEGHT
jgi:DNA repair protein RecO (recombination protein O)